MVEIIEVDTADKAQARQFLQLPFEVYQDVPEWVPPLAMTQHSDSTAGSIHSLSIRMRRFCWQYRTPSPCGRGSG